MKIPWFLEKSQVTASLPLFISFSKWYLLWRLLFCSVHLQMLLETTLSHGFKFAYTANCFLVVLSSQFRLKKTYVIRICLTSDLFICWLCFIFFVFLLFLCVCVGARALKLSSSTYVLLKKKKKKKNFGLIMFIFHQVHPWWQENKDISSSIFLWEI